MPRLRSYRLVFGIVGLDNVTFVVDMNLFRFNFLIIVFLFVVAVRDCKGI